MDVESSWSVSRIIKHVVEHEMQYLKEKCTSISKIKADWLKPLANGEVEAVPLDVRARVILLEIMRTKWHT